MIHRNYQVSPFTGLDKKSWIEIARELMKNIIDENMCSSYPIILKRREFDISYPHKFDSKYHSKEASFESLSRTFFLASILVSIGEGILDDGTDLTDFYKRWILDACAKGSSCYLGDYEDMVSWKKKQDFGKNILKKILRKRNDKNIFQHTCEAALLCVGLEISKTQIWNNYTKNEQDRIACFLKSFGLSSTHSHNWQWFNVFILSFLYDKGYIDNTSVVEKLLNNIREMHAGDGWFSDGGAFDYYNAWTFHFYGPLFNRFYGYKYFNEYAHEIDKWINEFIRFYSIFFDIDGKMTMYGRSNIYRNASTVPFVSGFFTHDFVMDPGYARWIVSACLGQFLSHDGTFNHGIPSLGFYGEFKPMLQSYSCVYSPFWMYFPFLCLVLPNESVFWNAIENKGIWNNISGNKLYTSKAAHIAVYHNKINGSVELFPFNVQFPDGHHLIDCYIRDAFSSEFLWDHLKNNGSEAMQYSLKQGGTVLIPNEITYNGSDQNSISRSMHFSNGMHIDMKNIIVGNGFIKYDILHISDAELTFGSYALPVYEDIKIHIGIINGCNYHIIDNGIWQVAFLAYKGIEQLQEVKRHGTNPEKEDSVFICGKVQKDATNIIIGVYEKRSSQIWLENELFPEEVKHLL